MDKAARDQEPIVRVDFGFRRELAEKIEGNLANYCYQCGACVGDCPATTYGSGFNPREIMLKVLYGLGDELLRADSVLWQCTNCYNCHERCPQEVKPVEVIISLKNMLADRGIVPDAVARVIQAFETTGRTAPIGPTVDRERERYGLRPLAPVPMDEIRALIEPSAPSQGPSPALRTPAPRQEEGRRFAFLPGLPDPHPAPGHGIRHSVGPGGPRGRAGRPRGCVVLSGSDLLQVQRQALLADGGGAQPRRWRRSRVSTS